MARRVFRFPPEDLTLVVERPATGLGRAVVYKVSCASAWVEKLSELELGSVLTVRLGLRGGPTVRLLARIDQEDADGTMLRWQHRGTTSAQKLDTILAEHAQRLL